MKVIIRSCNRHLTGAVLGFRIKFIWRYRYIEFKLASPMGCLWFMLSPKGYDFSGIRKRSSAVRAPVL